MDITNDEDEMSLALSWTYFTNALTSTHQIVQKTILNQ